MKGWVREYMLNKIDMPGRVNAIGRGVNAEVGTLMSRVADEDTRGGSWLKFVSGLGTYPWVAETPKATEF